MASSFHPREGRYQALSLVLILLVALPLSVISSTSNGIILSTTTSYQEKRNAKLRPTLRSHNYVRILEKEEKDGTGAGRTDGEDSSAGKEDGEDTPEDDAKKGDEKEKTVDCSTAESCQDCIDLGKTFTGETKACIWNKSDDKKCKEIVKAGVADSDLQCSDSPDLKNDEKHKDKEGKGGDVEDNDGSGGGGADEDKDGTEDGTGKKNVADSGAAADEDKDGADEDDADKKKGGADDGGATDGTDKKNGEADDEGSGDGTDKKNAVPDDGGTEDGTSKNGTGGGINDGKDKENEADGESKDGTEKDGGAIDGSEKDGTGDGGGGTKNSEGKGGDEDDKKDGEDKDNKDTPDDTSAPTQTPIAQENDDTNAPTQKKEETNAPTQTKAETSSPTQKKEETSAPTVAGKETSSPTISPTTSPVEKKETNAPTAKATPENTPEATSDDKDDGAGSDGVHNETPAPTPKPVEPVAAPTPTATVPTIPFNTNNYDDDSGPFGAIFALFFMVGCGYMAFKQRHKFMNLMDKAGNGGGFGSSGVSGGGGFGGGFGSGSGDRHVAAKYQDYPDALDEDDGEWGWGDDEDDIELSKRAETTPSFSSYSDDSSVNKRKKKSGLTIGNGTGKSPSIIKQTQPKPLVEQHVPRLSKPHSSPPPQQPKVKGMSLSKAKPAMPFGSPPSDGTPPMPSSTPAAVPIMPSNNTMNQPNSMVAGGMPMGMPGSMPMGITSLGAKKPIVKKQPPKPKPTEEDDIFASMGISSKPTFSHTPTTPRTATPSTASTGSRWNTHAPVVNRPTSGTTGAFTMPAPATVSQPIPITATSAVPKADDWDDDWDDDGDLDDLLDD